MSFGRCSISSGSLNVRASASTSASVLFQIKKNEVATILSSTGNWYKIDHPNGIGYVSKDYFDVIGSHLTTITVHTESSSGNLNIRSGPGTEYPIVFRAPNSTSLLMYEEGTEWTLVGDGEQIGWGSNDYLIYQGGSTPGGEAHDNSLYTYEQVRNNEGTYVSVVDGAAATYSDGVLQMQTKLVAIGCLTSIHEVTQGVFDAATRDAILSLQHTTLNLAVDPVVGKRTLHALDMAYDPANRPYFMYGNFLDATEWNRSNIRAYRNMGKSNGFLYAIDSLARVIHAEEHHENKTNAQTAVALTIRKRSIDGDTTQKPGNCPDSPLIDVITAPSQYSTAEDPKSNIGTGRAPHRATYSSTMTSASSFLNPMWKNAVDLAKKLYYNESIAAPTGAYRMEKMERVGVGYYTDQMYQIGNILYDEWIDKEYSMSNIICFYSPSENLPKTFNVFLDRP